MANLDQENHLTLQLDASELSPGQQRLIRYINSVLLHVITTHDEAEYFDGSNQAMRMLAALIRQANFAQKERERNSDIPYPVQALEFCMETMAQDLAQDKEIIFDN